MPRQGGLHEKLQTSGMWNLVMSFDWADFLRISKAFSTFCRRIFYARASDPIFAVIGRQRGPHMDVKSLCMMSGRKASNRRRGVLHEIGETFNYDDVYCSDRYQMRVRLAGLACLTALRDKERRATHCLSSSPLAHVCKCVLLVL